MARKHDHISSLFDFIARVLNVVGSSCKWRDMLREKQTERTIKALEIGEIFSGQGLNQKTNRSGDTLWGSHYNTLLSLINMFAPVIDVLEFFGSDALITSHRTEAQDITDRLLSFEFIFSLFLMKKVLAITNELSQALQRKDQDIVNAMNLVKVSKLQLQVMRESGWSCFLEDVSLFCNKHGIGVLDMNAKYVTRGQRRRNEEELTNLYHYRVETFYTILDMQLQELNARFSDSNTELLLCVSCLIPSNSFSHFDKKRLLWLAEYYPKDFSQFDKWKLSDQLDTYIVDMRLSTDFTNLSGIGELASKMVETGRNKVYPLVYLLLTMALILPVAIASVERAFSAMNIIKNRLRNRMNDEWLNDSLFKRRGLLELEIKL
ncbi:uncharacterized protein LOC119985532 [Tripterygium wilfordii]|uniref:uncharacterized protein LOC119985532 n=1 Tax=Tripterygium wilfordii TaxID=458696 RepID=UPI0018F7F984|nr:uncharacterized protein LOC119985532 [Tripterygium wilfordii]